jgi:cytochrome c peroxidase
MNIRKSVVGLPCRPLGLAVSAAICLGLAGCGGGGGGSTSVTPPPALPPPTTDDLLRDLIERHELTGDPTAGRQLPSIDDPLAQLGKKLFFSKSLGGDMDTACASCHHPALGGGDGLSLPVGTGAVEPDVVGPGRTRPDGLPNVGRNSQTVFNVALYDKALFWDSRIESIGGDDGLNGSGTGIRTPDTPLLVEDTEVPPGSTLPAAQARFPVAVPEEMRGVFLPGADNAAVREHLAARIGNYGAAAGELSTNEWLDEFQAAFVSAEPAEDLITFEHIMLAIAEYQRSMIFVETPWKAYVEGDLDAISEDAKVGALLFFRTLEEDGIDCVSCHSGDFFTDERQTIVGFPQLGPGKGDGANGDQDFGREQQTGDTADRFKFRTPTLLNIAVTGPYTHSGVFDNLDFVNGHYAVPELIFEAFIGRGGVCGLGQFEDHPDCGMLFENLVANSESALAAALETRATDPDLTFPDASDRPPSDSAFMHAFLDTLTDPCVLDRDCLAPWIPTRGEAPDENQLNAIDTDGNPL